MSSVLHRALEFFVAPEAPAITGHPASGHSASGHSASGHSASGHSASGPSGPGPSGLGHSDSASSPGAAARTSVAPAAVGVLGAPGVVAPVAALLAAQVRLRFRAGCVLVADWSPEERAAPRGGTSARAARQLASRLEGRDLVAGAQGRSIALRLPADPLAAGLAWRRALAASNIPSICALEGPRPVELEPILEALDLIVVVVGSEACADLGRLAIAGLEHSRAAVLTCTPVSGGAARLGLSSSIAISRLLGEDVARAVRALA